LARVVGQELEVVTMHSTHFNPIVIWQDARRGPQEVSREQRHELLKRTTAYKQSPWLKPVKLGYQAAEKILGTVLMADNLVVVARKKSAS
jgi:hypothetical protein